MAAAVSLRPAPRMSRGVRAARAVAVTLLLVGGLGYSAWLLEAVLPLGLSPVHSYTTEASALDQPYSRLFRVADVGSGAAFVLAVPFLLRLVPAQFWPRMSVTAIGLFGMNLLVAAAYPLDCARSASEQCRQRIATDEVPTAHWVHVATWTFTVLLYLASCACAERWWPEGFWRRAARTAFVLVLASALGMVALELLAGGRYVGLLERFQLLTMVALLVVGTAYLLDSARLRHAAGLAYRHRTTPPAGRG
ncbi:Protein of unknown function [Amycolatopsis arida]|uniref:DUF998 domain-containing protein n=1 Tax=Amycolatopsis arida TaxID=587909 RepID=A0A1I6AZL2_9PSEU|nr:DUF998 domain-containing protein [Amycolatopsis arida]TDX92167.1 uncharacterized protein DUF998 [Amycolatopsis arida]SFQ74145.1 Protein of unknown function [Amycolatopsis arida]